MRLWVFSAPAGPRAQSCRLSTAPHPSERPAIGSEGLLWVHAPGLSALNALLGAVVMGGAQAVERACEEPFFRLLGLLVDVVANGGRGDPSALLAHSAEGMG